jgi:hypothetical protein
MRGATAEVSATSATKMRSSTTADVRATTSAAMWSTTAAANSRRIGGCRQAERKADGRRSDRNFAHDVTSSPGTNAKAQRRIARTVPAASKL